MTALDQALALIGRKPTPKDIEQQLDALMDQATDDERPLIESLYEQLFPVLND